MGKMITRPHSIQNQWNRPSKPYIPRGRGCRNYPSYDRGYDRYRENFRIRWYGRNRTWYSLSRGRPWCCNNQRGSLRRQDNYRNTTDSRQQRFRSLSRSPAWRPGVASRSPSGDEDICFSCRHLGHFAKIVLRKSLLQAKCMTERKDWISMKDVPLRVATAQR